MEPVTSVPTATSSILDGVVTSKSQVGCQLQSLDSLGYVTDISLSSDRNKRKSEGLFFFDDLENDHVLSKRLKYSSDDEGDLLVDFSLHDESFQDTDTDAGFAESLSSDAGDDLFESPTSLLPYSDDTVLSDLSDILSDPLMGPLSDCLAEEKQCKGGGPPLIQDKIEAPPLVPALENEEKLEVKQIHPLVGGLNVSGPNNNYLSVLDNIRPSRLADSLCGAPRLVVGPEPQQVFYKDEGGSFLYCGVDLFGYVMDDHLTPAKTSENLRTNSVPLECSLVFEDGQELPTQDRRFLQIGNPGGTARLQLSDLRAVVQFRIKQVSNNMGGKRVRLKVAVKDCPEITPLFTAPIEVKSKRKTLAAAVRNKMTCDDLKSQWSRWAYDVNAVSKN